MRRDRWRRGFESYLDGSLLWAVGLPDQNLGTTGAGPEAGLRMQLRF